ncbi:MAG TPA: Ig-like domain-containing protein [Gemmatimonadota bacterium]|nr:Ig-like domain-containing protein [Gemmatimonadota bacterium]
MKRFGRIGCAGALLAIASACTGVGPFDPNGGEDASLTPSNPVLRAIGATRQLQLTIGDGVNVSGQDVQWTSTAPSVATVNSSGMVTAVNDGVTAIVADFNGLRATTTVSVQATIAATFQVTASQTDNNTANNTATARVTVIAD